MVLLLATGVKYGLDIYTRHDEGIPVPNVTNMDFSKAQSLLEMDGLCIEVSPKGKVCGKIRQVCDDMPHRQRLMVILLITSMVSFIP